MSLIRVALFFAVALFTSAGRIPPEQRKLPSELAYRSACRHFTREDYDRAFEKFSSYLALRHSERHSESYDENRGLWSLQNMLTIIIQTENTPEKTQKRLVKSLPNHLARNYDPNILEAWHQTLKEWQATYTPPAPLSTEVLLKQGIRFYEMGIDMNRKRPTSGHAALNIATLYLKPFILYHDNHKRLAEVLFMLGSIHNYTATDPTYWSKNHYLEESIRRFPGTPLAQKSFQMFKDEYNKWLTGSPNAQLPSNAANHLEHLEKVAYNSQTNSSHLGKKKF